MSWTGNCKEVCKGSNRKHFRFCRPLLQLLTTAIAAGDTTKARLEEYPVGGLIYFAANLKDREQTMTMIENSQKYSLERSGIPLFISVDEEGGDVARCSYKLGTTALQPMYGSVPPAAARHDRSGQRPQRPLPPRRFD